MLHSSLSWMPSAAISSSAGPRQPVAPWLQTRLAAATAAKTRLNMEIWLGLILVEATIRARSWAQRFPRVANCLRGAVSSVMGNPPVTVRRTESRLETPRAASDPVGFVGERAPPVEPGWRHAPDL